MKLLKFCFFFFLLSCFAQEGFPTVQQPRIDLRSVQDYYSLTIKAFQEKNWQSVLYYSKALYSRFPNSSFSQEVSYYQGVSYFHLKEYEFADHAFSEYLSKQLSPKFFEDVISYKFAIAEQFRVGAGKHVFGWKKLPKWLSAKEEAIKIYDEIIHALPLSDFAISSLFSKAKILFEMEQYSESIETYRQLIQKNPKHSLAVESYLEIGKIYLTQCRATKGQSFDWLDLAEVNAKKFKEAFPGEDRHQQILAMIGEMREHLAEKLFETGRFYERRNQPKASILYYSQILSQFPGTKNAKLSQKRLDVLKKNV